MGDSQDEKQEKQEKEEEKDEKGRGEKWRNDPLSGIIWAFILIWAGLIFLGNNLGWFRRLEIIDPWGLVFLGAGALVLMEALIRVLMPQYRRPVTGTIIFGIILLTIGFGIGFGNWLSWGLIGGLILVIIGVGMLVRGMRGGR